MILADTSLWIEHLRRGHRGLADQLGRGGILCHPIIIGELACGSLSNRGTVLQLLDSLPKALECSHAEARQVIENDALFSAGIGFADVHLLASARLSRAPLWTLDRRLDQVASRLGLAYRAG